MQVETAKQLLNSSWDTETQQVHGGQTWRALGDKYVEDFSVTTNAFGAPKKAIEAAKLALETSVHHYPPADCAEATQALAEFMKWDSKRLLLGNGASDFIDLFMRCGTKGPFRPGPYIASYMEYYRAAKAAGREILPCFDATEHSGVTVIIRPNSPTGDFMPLNELETILKNSKYGLVVIDESFMPFQGPNWRKESALQLIDSYPGRLIVIHSWTKFWSCPGIRLGSVAASSDWIKEAKRLQIPWSCNTVAQAFLVAACSDEEYMRQTWSTLPEWRKEQETIVEELGWKYNKNSPLWVPWVFVDCGDASVAEQAAAVALSVGCPVRHCASFGCPQYIRLGVRDPKYQQILYKAWKNHFDSQRNNP
ncbi:hypothetical protein GAYE_SCF46G5861 [Galdieria yellowstonensis]|uniref:Aminotransferase class I/classII large domain-containing protein n=1 Tax=Galdieria yellowstonensis TaxID=3028027 RepID=A0AAV9IKH3_9RHOD|nr:hypothetical protein GAYE_SCF46G5861 [Galdieria yellowstonensis]